MGRSSESWESLPLMDFYLEYAADVAATRGCAIVTTDEGAPTFAIHIDDPANARRIGDLFAAYRSAEVTGTFERPTIPVSFTEDGEARLYLPAFIQFWAGQPVP